MRKHFEDLEPNMHDRPNGVVNSFKTQIEVEILGVVRLCSLVSFLA